MSGNTKSVKLEKTLANGQNDIGNNEIENVAADNEDELEIQPALLVSYEEKIRPCIDLIDKLRALGIEQDVHLPTIAVVGDQSAGKSSVLEAISGVQLPRGTGIVTRCPLELRMKHVPSNNPWRARIKFSDSSNPGAGNMCEEITTPNHVGTYVCRAQDALAGSGRGVSNKLITLEVESHNVPDLTLIDLPGIARIALDDQPFDLPDQIRRLIKSYIERQETIILAVIPANIDIATTEALQLAKQYDKDGDRTLGVVTKPDLVDRGSEQELIAVLSNTRLPLKKGYTCVKCRGQKALQSGMSLEDAISAEEEYFSEAEHFRDFQGSNMLGTKSLAKKLTLELVEHIARSLPALRKTVREKLALTHERLQKLGRGIPANKSDRQFRFVEVMKGFSDELQKLIEGRPTEDTKEFRMFNRFRVAFNVFAKTVDQYSPKMVGHERDQMLKQLEREMDESRGPELPRFLNYQMFIKKANIFISDYREPMLKTLKLVSDITKDIYDKLISSYYGQYPELQRAVKGKIFLLIQDAQEASEKKLLDYFEMEKLVYTQDAVFTGKLDKVLAERYKDFENKNKSMPRPQHAYFGASLQSKVEDDVTAPDIRIQAEAMYDFILSYVMIAKRRISDMVPMVLLHELIEKLGANVRTSILAMVADASMIDKFKENEAAAQDRLMNQRRYDRLQNALTELETFAY